LFSPRFGYRNVGSRESEALLRRLLLFHHARMRVVRVNEDGLYAIQPLATQAQALRYLSRCAGRAGSMAKLRALLAEFEHAQRGGRSGTRTDFARLPEKDILGGVADLVVAGRVVVAEQRDRTNAPTVLDDQPDGPPPPGSG
jgi:hypothetical protein